MPTSNFFLDTIYALRTTDELILYTVKKEFSTWEEKVVIDFLEEEYNKESTHYPFAAPAFNANAAIWAAKLLYTTAYFYLNRTDDVATVIKRIKTYSEKPTVEEMLSADLVLRFLPQLYNELKRLDFEDSILPLLHKQLQYFHYAAIGMDIEMENVDLSIVFQSQCFQQLYLNRIVERKDIQIAKVEEIAAALRENFGAYKENFWRNL
jgi:hypothetical protein